MKVNKIERKLFTPIAVEVIIETEEELRLLKAFNSRGVCF